MECNEELRRFDPGLFAAEAFLLVGVFGRLYGVYRSAVFEPVAVSFRAALAGLNDGSCQSRNLP